MNNFMLLESGIDVVPIVHSIRRQPGLWKLNTIRQDFPGSPHGNTESIILRFNEIKTVSEVMDDKECFDFDAYQYLPEVRPLIRWLMHRVEGERLGRLMIVNLPKDGAISAHRDEGAPAEYYDRYHVALHALPGVGFRAGAEVIEMRTGELWWFDNRQEHEVINRSGSERIHLIADIRTRASFSGAAP